MREGDQGIKRGKKYLHKSRGGLNVVQEALDMVKRKEEDGCSSKVKMIREVEIKERVREGKTPNSIIYPRESNKNKTSDHADATGETKLKEE